MLFSLNGDNGKEDNHSSSSHSSHNSSSNKATTMEERPQSSQPAAATANKSRATVTPSTQAKPLFQIPQSNRMPSTTVPPLFTIPDTTSSSRSSSASGSAVGSGTPNIVTAAPSVASSSSSNSSQGSFHNNNNDHRSDSMDVDVDTPPPPLFQTNTTTNNNNKSNNNNHIARRFTLASAYSSTPDLFSADSGFAFPTLHQVKQQSQRHQQQSQQQSTRHRRLPVVRTETLTDAQKATLDRVVRLAARMTNVPVAVISNLGMETPSFAHEASVLAQHGYTQVSWKAQAKRVLQTDPKEQQDAGVAYYQHLPIIGTIRGQPQQRIGSLTLMAQQHRSPLSFEERQDLEDLIFLAAQTLTEPHLTSNTTSSSTRTAAKNHRRQVSTPLCPTENMSQSYSTPGRRRRASSTTPPAHPLDPTQDTPSFSQEQDDPSQCIIACTAHDLLTPLMGLQLSLSLLQEDAKFVRHLEEQPLQRESFWTAWQSTEVMFRMCQTTIDTLRANKEARVQQTSTTSPSSSSATPSSNNTPDLPTKTQICHLDVNVLLHSLQRLLDPIPKQVPLVMTLPGSIPNQVPIVTTTATITTTTTMTPSPSINHNNVDWNILRCALTVLSHACRISNSHPVDTTNRQPIRLQFRITHDDPRLVMECHHDCPPEYNNAIEDDLALQSVAQQMQTVYGGQHGFERLSQQEGRGVFWFSVPVDGSALLTTQHPYKQDRILTLLPQPTEATIQEELLPGLEAMDCSEPGQSHNTKKSKQKPQQQNQDSPNYQGRGLRRWRRSSTGSTNTLGGRRRTFHDMEGLRGNEATAGALWNFKSHQIPAPIPTMIKAQSTIGYGAADSKRNYEFQSNKARRLNQTNTLATTARSAIASALQANWNMRSGTFDNKNGRLSCSVLNEKEAVSKERLLPQNWIPDPGNKSVNDNGTGLDRCFKDLMGSSTPAVDNVRERLYNRSSSNGSNLGLNSNVNTNSNSKPQLALAPTQRERKALVIEDSVVIRKTVARALAKLGIQTVVQANDGLEGIARMKEEVFDITLCDFSMPNLGGIDCVKQYRQWEKRQSLTRPKQYIVGMSAHASPNDIASGLQVGMNEYHPKPLTIKRLSELLESSPLQQTRCELDREWQRKKSLSGGMSPSTSAGRNSLFDDITRSTVTMLDAMSSSQRSQVSCGEDPVESKGDRPEKAPLFSINPITSS